MRRFLAVLQFLCGTVPFFSGTVVLVREAVATTIREEKKSRILSGSNGKTKLAPRADASSPEKRIRRSPEKRIRSESKEKRKSGRRANRKHSSLAAGALRSFGSWIASWRGFKPRQDAPFGGSSIVSSSGVSIQEKPPVIAPSEVSIEEKPAVIAPCESCAPRCKLPYVSSIQDKPLFKVEKPLFKPVPAAPSLSKAAMPVLPESPNATREAAQAACSSAACSSDLTNAISTAPNSDSHVLNKLLLRPTSSESSLLDKLPPDIALQTFELATFAPIFHLLQYPNKHSVKAYSKEMSHSSFQSDSFQNQINYGRNPYYDHRDCRFNCRRGQPTLGIVDDLAPEYFKNWRTRWQEFIGPKFHENVDKMKKLSAVRELNVENTAEKMNVEKMQCVEKMGTFPKVNDISKCVTDVKNMSLRRWPCAIDDIFLLAKWKLVRRDILNRRDNTASDDISNRDNTSNLDLMAKIWKFKSDGSYDFSLSNSSFSDVGKNGSPSLEKLSTSLETMANSLETAVDLIQVREKKSCCDTEMTRRTYDAGLYLDKEHIAGVFEKNADKIFKKRVSKLMDLNRNNSISNSKGMDKNKSKGMDIKGMDKNKMKKILDTQAVSSSRSGSVVSSRSYNEFFHTDPADESVLIHNEGAYGNSPIQKSVLEDFPELKNIEPTHVIELSYSVWTYMKGGFTDSFGRSHFLHNGKKASEWAWIVIRRVKEREISKQDLSEDTFHQQNQNFREKVDYDDGFDQSFQRISVHWAYWMPEKDENSNKKGENSDNNSDDTQDNSNDISKTFDPRTLQWTMPSSPWTYPSVDFDKLLGEKQDGMVRLV